MAPHRDDESHGADTEEVLQAAETDMLLPKAKTARIVHFDAATGLSKGENKEAEDDEAKKPPVGNGVEDPRMRHTMGSCYMLAMGMCGVVLVALGSTLEDLAENCGKVSTDVGSVFIARGIGAVAGAIFSSRLYRWFGGNSVITWALLGLAGLLLSLPFITNVILLHLNFLCLGLSTAITDTGCQIMTRRVHGRRAGPWLGANTVAFGVTGAIVPALSYATTDLFLQFAILSGLGIVTVVWFLLLPSAESLQGFIRKAPGPSTRRSDAGGFFAAYRLEIVISLMVFWLIGGKVGITAYLTQYVEDTGVMNENLASALIVVLWTSITAGRLVGLQAQRHMTLGRLYGESTFLFIAGSLSILLVLFFPNSAGVLWTSVALYGFLNGPTVGFCYDLNNRTTLPCETGMSVIMFGLNSGASFIPYVISALWEAFDLPIILMVTVFISQIVPYPLMLLAKSYHQSKMVQH